MKHIYISLTIAACIILFLNACETGNNLNEKVTQNGISVETIELKVNDTLEQRNIFTYGELVTFNFKNVQGLKREKGEVFPKCAIYIVTAKQDTIETNEQIYTGKGIFDDPLNLNIRLQAGLAQSYNEEYTLKVKITDAKSENNYHFEMPITIIENERFTIKANNISYKAIYLLDKTTNTVIIDNKVKKKDGVVILYEGIDGLQGDDIEYVYAGLSIKLTDNSGKVILENKNMLDTYEVLGFKKDDIAQRLPINIAFDDTSIENPVKLTATLFDLKSDRTLILETDLKVE